jgi:hypothetical protein
MAPSRHLFRHFKGKDAEREGISLNAHDLGRSHSSVTATATQPSNNVPPKKAGFWKSFDWPLMGALLIPVVLETLDYTSEFHF